jgi:hypothetical protein
MRVRLLCDPTQEDTILETERDSATVLRDAVQVMRKSNRRQSVFRLCLHVAADTLTLHWFADDEKFAAAIMESAATVTRATAAILAGRCA